MASPSLALIAKDTVNYMTRSVANGTRLGQLLIAARNNTTHYKEEDTLSLVQRSQEELHQTTIEVTREDTLFAAKRCCQTSVSVLQ